MVGINELIKIGELAGGVLIGLLIIVGVEELSLRISAYIQYQIQSDGLFAERLDNGISMVVFGVLLSTFILAAGFNIKVNAIGKPHLPTIGAIAGVGCLLLGAAETIYLLKYKIPLFKSRYNADF